MYRRQPHGASETKLAAAELTRLKPMPIVPIKKLFAWKKFVRKVDFPAVLSQDGNFNHRHALMIQHPFRHLDTIFRCDGYQAQVESAIMQRR